MVVLGKLRIFCKDLPKTLLFSNVKHVLPRFTLWGSKMNGETKTDEWLNVLLFKIKSVKTG